MTLAFLIVAVITALAVIGLLSAIHDEAKRIAHALEQANGIARTATMFPDDPPAP